MYLVFEVVQNTGRSNKENPSAYWHATLSCPFMASNYEIRSSFRSRSDLVLDADHALDFVFYPISFCRPVSRFVVFQTKVAHSCFCLVRIKCRCSHIDMTCLRRSIALTIYHQGVLEGGSLHGGVSFKAEVAHFAA